MPQYHMLIVPLLSCTYGGGWFGGPSAYGVVVVVKLFGVHYPRLVRKALARILATQQVPVVWPAEGGRVWCGLVCLLCRAEAFSSACSVLSGLRSPVYVAQRSTACRTPPATSFGHEAGLL